jgi:citronellol/citronellal dehydrogenase
MTGDDRSLAGQTLIMSGGSRGIGRAIALRAARDGANIALLAKTDTPDPRLPGTVHSAAREIEAVGGNALPVVGDVREEVVVRSFVDQAATAFGGVDIVVNNASAIALEDIDQLSLKRYDLMMDVNSRGTFLLTQASLPWLRNSSNAHVLTLSPPINLDQRWLGSHTPYTLSKYGMTVLTIGFAESCRNHRLAANCLWPATYIATAAVANVAGGPEMLGRARRPEIMADAAYLVLTTPAAERTGECLIDEAVLKAAGVADLSTYLNPGTTEDELAVDLFL